MRYHIYRRESPCLLVSGRYRREAKLIVFGADIDQRRVTTYEGYEALEYLAQNMTEADAAWDAIIQPHGTIALDTQ